jgi:hypothetical protein
LRYGQEENRKAVLMQAAAENAKRGNEADHAPAVVKAGDALAHVSDAQSCRGGELQMLFSLFKKQMLAHRAIHRNQRRA